MAYRRYSSAEMRRLRLLLRRKSKYLRLLSSLELWEEYVPLWLSARRLARDLKEPQVSWAAGCDREFPWKE